MNKNPVQVFLDANVVIQAGKPPGGPTLARVADLVKGGFISVLTTDLTKTEVAKKHAQNDFDVIKDIARSHFRKIAKEVANVEIPALTKAQIYNHLFKKYADQTEAMFADLGSSTLSINAVKPSLVFDAYADKTGLFSGEGKKDQFPDAFIFECLKAEASAKKPIVIVSDDGDFVASVEAEKYISVLKSIPDLFISLGLRVDAPDVRDFLEAHRDDALELIDAELSNWSLQATDVERAQIEETNVTEIDFVKLISFGKVEKGDDILVVGRVRIKANVSYSHPNWDDAMYDSEDKVLIPFEDVSGEAEINTEANFSMSILIDDDGKPEAIEEVQFTDDKFIWVDLHAYDPRE